MEIYQIRAYVTVARLGHLTRAADALHVTQPAVTAQIKALEQDLGVALFDRKPSGITLTRAGELLLPEAEKVLAAINLLSGRSKQIKGQLTGRLVVGTVADPDFLRLGSLLSGLLSHMPLVELKTQHGHAEQILQAVERGDFDAGFYIGNLSDARVSYIVLRSVQYRVVAPLALREQLSKAAWSDVAALPWIGAPHESHLNRLLREMLNRQSLAPNIVVETDEISELHNLVRAGVGLTLMREDLALKRAEMEELLIWEHARLDTQLAFIYSDRSESDPVFMGLVSVLRQTWNSQK